MHVVVVGRQTSALVISSRVSSADWLLSPDDLLTFGNQSKTEVIGSSSSFSYFNLAAVKDAIFSPEETRSYFDSVDLRRRADVPTTDHHLLE